MSGEVDFRDKIIKKLRRQLRDLEMLRDEEASAYRLKHRLGTLVRESNELFVENRKLREKLARKQHRSIDPAYIVAVCKAITGEQTDE